MNSLCFSRTVVQKTACCQQSKKVENKVTGFFHASRGVQVRDTVKFDTPRQISTLTRCTATEPQGHQKKAKVKVELGEYKNGAIKVNIPGCPISDEEVESRFKTKQETTYRLDRINFTSGGAKIGHTVKINFEGKFADGPKNGQSIPGTKANMFELDLEEGKPMPWAAFVSEIVKNGMGQEESKSFEATFPEDYAAKPMRGVKARFTVTVKEISKKEMLEKDTRPEDVQRAEIRESMQEAAQAKVDLQADNAIRAVLEKTSTADTQKVADSVSWAKFGPKSMAEFTWNLILEEVSLVEGIAFEEVPAFLRSHAVIEIGENTDDAGEDEEEIAFT